MDSVEAYPQYMRGDEMTFDHKAQMITFGVIDSKLDELSELLGEIKMSKEDAKEMQGMIYKFFEALEEKAEWE